MTSQHSRMDRYPVVIFSSLPPRAVCHLAERLVREVPEAEVVGVLYEPPTFRTLPGRISSFVRNLRKWGFWLYAGQRAVTLASTALGRIGHALLRLAHAATHEMNDPVDYSLGAMSRRIEALGGRAFVSRNIHAPEALAFVRELAPRLGLVYGTRILKPELFEIPTDGSINIHKRKVPDYRGGGPIGLWELIDDQPEIGITVHRVTSRVDAGHVVRSTVLPIEPFDTLRSLELKANVVGADLLLQAVTDFARGCVSDTPQQPGGRVFRTPAPEQMRRYLKVLARKRRPFLPRPERPIWKLAARVLLLGPRAIVRNWSCRRRRAFPVVILYHHVITDRPHTMGLSTEQFFRHGLFLARHYQIVTLPEAIDRLASGTIDAPTVVLTFDDGYADNVLNVRAVAEALDISATFFICSDHVATGRPFRHDLKAGNAGFAPMTWNQARDLRNRGFHIASHTRTHFDCGSEDEVALREELGESRREIEAALGQPIAHFSFPWGRPSNMSGTAVRVARETYDVILSACNGVNVPGRRPPVHLLRCVHPGTVLELELTLQSLLELDPEGARLPF